jgi:23S rRNA A1618 N6-methylase RlmF
MVQPFHQIQEDATNGHHASTTAMRNICGSSSTRNKGTFSKRESHFLCNFMFFYIIRLSCRNINTGSITSHSKKDFKFGRRQLSYLKFLHTNIRTSIYTYVHKKDTNTNTYSELHYITLHYITKNDATMSKC